MRRPLPARAIALGLSLALATALPALPLDAHADTPAGNDKLRIEKALSDPKDRAQYVRDLLRHLGQPLKG